MTWISYRRALPTPAPRLAGLAVVAALLAWPVISAYGYITGYSAIRTDLANEHARKVAYSSEVRGRKSVGHRVCPSKMSTSSGDWRRSSGRMFRVFHRPPSGHGSTVSSGQYSRQRRDFVS